MSKFLTIDSTNKASIEAGASNGDAYFNTDSSEVWVWDTTLTTPDWRKYSSSGLANSFLNEYSLEFDGVDSYAAGVSYSLPQPFSFSFWAKKIGNGTSMVASGAGTNWMMLKNDGNFWFRGPGGEKNFGSYPTGVWAHYVFSVESNSANLYVNGQHQSTQAYTSGWTMQDVGRSVSYANMYFSGSIDEFAVFDAALTEADSNNIYRGEGAGGPGTGAANTIGDLSTFASGNGPIHWYRMGDQGDHTGTSLTDIGSAAVKYDLTLTNFDTTSFSTDLPS